MDRVVTDVYEFEDIIGEGAFSNVVLATHNETKTQFAIKIVDKSKIENDVQRERVDREINILKKCNHPNVIKLVETYESDLEISLVLELMKGGDLFERITSKGTFSEEEARIAMYNIFSAVDYLHDKGIVHRDLKPENLLYSGKEAAATLKIADFGLAKYATESEGLATPCGTIAYTAPEVTSNRVYRKAVDIWSCGCILYFMLFGRPPFYSNEEEEIYDLVSEGEYSFPAKSAVSDSARELIGHLLEKNPTLRYTAKEVLLHSWMTGRSSKPRDIFGSPPGRPGTTMPLSISNIRVSLNSAIEAQRGPLTPPLASPLESTLWKKRMAKARTNGLAFSGSKLSFDLESEPELDLSDSDNNNDDIDTQMMEIDDMIDGVDMVKAGTRKQSSGRRKHQKGKGVGADNSILFPSEEDSEEED